MTRPPRLLDSSSNDALRSLLSSGLDDAPDAQALPKLAATLGLATMTVAAGGLTAVSAGAQAKAAALAGSAPATLVGSTALNAAAASSAGAAGFWGGSTALALGKTLLVSMVSAGTLSVGAVAVYESTNPTGAGAALVESVALDKQPGSGNEQPAPHAHAQKAPTADMSRAAEPAATVAKGSTASAARVVPPNALPGHSQRLAPQATRPANVKQASSTDAVAGPQRAGVLAREVQQIDSARQALESRDADGALAALDSYERSRIVGVLDREALLLKIEALSQKQDLGRANALTRQYLERFPTDAHAPRLRAQLRTSRGEGASREQGASPEQGTTASSIQTFPDE